MSATVTPHAGRNAIAQAQFAIEFANPVVADVLEDISRRHLEVQNFLPAKQETRGGPLVIFAHGSSVAPEVGNKPSLQAVEFRQHRPDGSIAWSLVAQGQFLSVTCSDYSRWDAVWKTVRDLLLRFSKSLIGRAQLSGIGLHYTDRFSIGGDHKRFAPDQVLWRDSPWVPRRVFDAKDLWHVHEGGFEELLDANWRYLINLNLDYNADEGDTSRSLVISSFHRALCQKPLMLDDTLLGENLKLDYVMPLLHKANKQALRELLNEQTCRSIGLREDNDAIS